MLHDEIVAMGINTDIHIVGKAEVHHVSENMMHVRIAGMVRWTT